MNDFDCQVGVEELQDYNDYLAMLEIEQFEREQFENEYNEWFDTYMSVKPEDVEIMAQV